MSMSARKDAVELPSSVTTRFGEFSVNPDEVLSFPVGIPGFERCRHFVLLTSEAWFPLQCLQSLDGPPASFLVVEPRVVLPDFRCGLSEADRTRLHVDEQSPVLWLALVTVTANEPPTVNLRAPLVINPARMLGYQVMPSDSAYPMRFPLET